MLQAVAHRIVQSLRPVDLVSRFGGDEFVVLLADVADRRVVEELVQRVLLAVEAPIPLQGQHIVVSPSIGVAMVPHDGRLPAELIKNADTAMYAAKADGRGACRFFETEMAAQAYAALVLEGQLAHALQRNEFALMLQPRVALDGSGLQVQALIRWLHPDRGWLAPESFLDVAEERRLMQPIVRWALSEAIAAQRAWSLRDGSVPTVALELSNLPLPLEAVADLAEQVCAESPPLGELSLDIGEAVLNEDAHALRQSVNRLQALGLSVAIDDFGVGTLALSRLRALPVRGLVLGRAFVASLPDDTAAATIAAAIVQMARGLKLGVTAKGVETRGATHLAGRHRLRPCAGTGHRVADGVERVRRLAARAAGLTFGCAAAGLYSGLLRLDRPFPVVQAGLARARHRQLAGRRVLGDRRAAADGGAVADRHRRHQHAVAADVHVVADHRAVLVGAVVVGGDAAGAVVDALADRRRRRGRPGGWPWRRAPASSSSPRRSCRCAPRRPRSAPGRSRANGPISAPLADRRAERSPSMCVNGWITRAGADAWRRGSRSSRRCARRRRARPAFEDAADVDLDVAAALQLAAHVEARRVGQAHAGFHQRVGAGGAAGGAPARRAAPGC